MPTFPREFLLAQTSQGSHSSGGGMSGKVEFYTDLQNLHTSWMNDIDDFVSPNDYLTIPSPYATYGTPKNITGITKANPAVVTAVGHGFTTGDSVVICGVGGMTFINDRVFKIVVLTNDTFSLIRTDTIPADYVAYTSGGYCYKATLVATYDPTTQIGEIVTAAAGYELAVNAIVTPTPAAGDTDWEAMVDKAVAAYDELYEEDDLTAAVDVYAARTDALYLREINRFTAGMVDINAVCSSAFIMGMANLAIERGKSIEAFHTELSMRKRDNKFSFITDAVNEMSVQKRTKLDAQRVAAQMVSDAAKLKAASATEVQEKNFELAVKDALWPVNRYQAGANILASIMGAVGSTPADNTTVGSVIGGALSGAAAGAIVGAKVGSVGGPMGALIGAGVGALSSVLD